MLFCLPLVIILLISSFTSHKKIQRQGTRHTTLQSPNEMPLDGPRQQLGLLLQLLRIVLAEMDLLDLGSLVQSQDVVGGLELGHGDEADGPAFGDGEDALLHALQLGDERRGPGGVDFEGG